MLAQLTTETFDKVRKAKLPVLVVFSASWCGPCKALKPHLMKASKKYANKALFFAMNVDGAENLANRYHVWSVPQIVLFLNGRIRGRVYGRSPKPDLDIQALLRKAHVAL